MGSSEFEMTAQYSFDEKGCSFLLHSESRSETLEMSLNTDPIKQVQTAFTGARCTFEVERSKEDEIEVYSSSLKNCVSNFEYDVYSFFEVNVNKDGKLVSSMGEPRFLDFPDDVIPRDQGPSVTINRLTMMKGNVQLNSIDFYVIAEMAYVQDMTAVLVWKSEII
jgi:hypothetical protein